MASWTRTTTGQPYTVYKGSAGGETTSASGFAFVYMERFKYRASATAPQQSMYGNYCSALGGWLQEAGGSSWSSTQYRTSGDYYNQGSAGTVGYSQGGKKGSISSETRTDSTSTTYYTCDLVIDSGSGNVYLSQTSGSSDVNGSQIGYTGGSKLTLTAVPDDGYRFVGWKLNNSSSYASRSATYNITMGNAARTMHAVFEGQITVTFDANGGDSDTTAIGYAGDALSTPTVTRTGYTFAGWSPSVPSTFPSSNATYTAQWTKDSYTVTLKGNQNTTKWPLIANVGFGSGSGRTLDTTAQLGYLDSLSGLPKPTATGYSFNYWHDATRSGMALGVYEYTDAHTFWAQWTANTYTVTLDRQSGSGGSASVTATYGQAMPSITPPVRAGYAFGGYYTSANGVGRQYYKADGTSANIWAITANTVLFAKWAANEYAVTLDRQSGSGGSASVTATYDSAMPSITPPVRTGYTFGGYYTATDGGGTKYYNADGTSARNWDVANSTTVLYAKWTANAYELTYDNLFCYLDWVHSASCGVTNTNYGSSLDTSDHANAKLVVTGGTAQHTYTRYGNTRQHYNIAVNPNTDYDFACRLAGTAKNAEVYYVELDANYAYVKSGNIPYSGLGGAAALASAGGVDYSRRFTTGANTRYVQLFFDVHDANAYAGFNDIRLVVSGGCVPPTRTPVRKHYVYNDNGTTKYGALDAPTRTGYTFAGWFTAAGTQVTANAVVSPQNTILYSRWTANTYTVTFKRMNGESDSTVTATYGQAMPSITPPVRTGYAFGGYWTEENGGGTQYYTASGAGARNWDRANSDAYILYAKWIRGVVVSLSSVVDGAGQEGVDLQGAGAGTPLLGVGASTRGETAQGDVAEGGVVALYASAKVSGLEFMSFAVTDADGRSMLPDNAQVSDTGDGYKTVSLNTVAGTSDLTATAFYRRDAVEAVALFGDGANLGNVLSIAPAATTRRFGDVVTFTAGSVTGYGFYGWSEEETAAAEVLSGGANAHVATLSGDMTLYAHYGRYVKVSSRAFDGDGVPAEGGGIVAVSLFGADRTADAASENGLLVPVGAAVRIVSTPAGSGASAFKFAGVYFKPETGAETPTDCGANANVVPSAAGTYIVEFRQNPPDVYLACADKAEEGASGTAGSTMASYAGTEEGVFTEVQVSDVPDAAKKTGGSVPAVLQGAKWYRVRKGTTVVLAASRSGASDALEWKGVEYTTLPLPAGSRLLGASGGGDGGLSAQQEAWVNKAYTVAGNALVLTEWGMFAKPKVTLKAQGGGSAVFAGESASVREKEFEPDTEIVGEEVVYTYKTATVRAEYDEGGGIVFDGWVNGNTGAVVSTAKEHSFEVRADTTLTAKFHMEVNVLYMWEGGSRNKTMEWQSGAIEMPRPCDPVAVRVDAAGYPVEASVGTYSSPDEEPTRQHAVQVEGQSARRLPRMRPERFWRLSVRADVEVDAIAVATNIAEAN